MLDSTNVLLLKPAQGHEIFARGEAARLAPGSDDDGAGPLWLVATHHLLPATPEPEAAALAEVIAEAVRAVGGDLAASLISEPAPNSFPRLPVREGESVVVTVLCPKASAAEEAMAALRLDSGRLRPFAGLFVRPPEIARLLPTSRSLLR